MQGNNVGDDESEDIMKTTIELAREAKVTPDLVAAHGQFFTRIDHLVALVRADERAASVHESDAASLFREALGFGWIYGPLIPAHQWNEMSEEKVAQLVARLATPPAQPAPVPTNCRHCGGPDNVLCGGQCKAAQPAPVTTREIDP